MKIKIAKEIYDKYNGIKLKDLQRIKEISCYNSNYYIGLKRDNKSINDLIFARSDDDNTTDLYIIDYFSPLRFAQCFTSLGDVIQVLETDDDYI